MSEEEVERYIAEKYGALDCAEEMSSVDDGDDEDYESEGSSIAGETIDGVARMTLQPSPKDPIMWLVRYVSRVML